MPFHYIYAIDKNFGFSKNDNIPWLTDPDIYTKQDMEFFVKTTLNNIVVMGKNTFLSLKNPLRNRINIVISNSLIDEKKYDNIIIFSSLYNFLTSDFLKKNIKRDIYVIGGKKIFESFDKLNIAKSYYITMFNKDYECDISYRQKIDIRECKIEVISNITTRYVLENKEENSLLELLDNIMKHGKEKNMRANRALSLFSPPQLYFQIKQIELDGNILYSLPLITHRESSLKAIFDELLWIIRGDTDSFKLKVNVWKDNTTREFLDKRGLNHLKEGDIGASYGYQMRNFGKYFKEQLLVDVKDEFKYENTMMYNNRKKEDINDVFNVEKTCKNDKEFDHFINGYDQLYDVINLIKKDPFSNRLIINLWNPNQLHLMSLPPCAYCYQFDVEVDEDGNPKYLNCKLTQRSSDTLLAGGWNITSVSLFLILMSIETGLIPNKIIWSPGNVHIYKNNYDIASDILIHSQTYNFPYITVNKKDKIEDYEYKDINLICYQCDKKRDIKMNA